MSYLTFYGFSLFTADKQNVVDTMILHQCRSNSIVCSFIGNVHLIHHQQMRSHQVQCFLKPRISARDWYVKNLIKKS